MDDDAAAERALELATEIAELLRIPFGAIAFSVHEGKVAYIDKREVIKPRSA